MDICVPFTPLPRRCHGQNNPVNVKKGGLSSQMFEVEVNSNMVLAAIVARGAFSM